MSVPKHMQPLCIPRRPPTVDTYRLCLRLTDPPLRIYEEDDWPLIEHIRQHGQLGSGSMGTSDFFDGMREDAWPMALDGNAAERHAILEEQRKRDESYAEDFNSPLQKTRRAAERRRRELDRIAMQKERKREAARLKAYRLKKKRERQRQDAEWHAAEQAARLEREALERGARDRAALARAQAGVRALMPGSAFDPDRGGWPRPPARGQACVIENNFFAYEGEEQNLIDSYPQWRFEVRGVRNGIVWLEVKGAQLVPVF